MESSLKPFPEPKWNIFSILTFWWMNPLIFLGFKQSLKGEDLYQLPNERNSESSYKSFLKYYQPNQGKSFILPLIKANFKHLFIGFFCRLYTSLSMFIPPIILDEILIYVVHRDPYYMGYIYAMTLFVSCLIESTITGQYEYRLSIASMKMRSAINCAIYQKSLKLSPGSRSKYSSGEINNLMAVDSNKINEIVMFGNVIWSSLLQISIALFLLWRQLGVASLSGLLTIFCMFPITFIVAKIMRSKQTLLMKKKDERSKLMNQILNGIKLIKLCNWESSFKKRIKLIRIEEMKKLTQLAVCYSFNTFTQDSAPIFVAITSFITFSLINGVNELTASKAFVSLALFNLIRTPLYQLPFIFQAVTVFGVSAKRINDYLNCEENDQQVDEHSDTANEDTDKIAIKITDGTFKWSKDEASPSILSDINLVVPKKKLIAVVGTVGAGKSSLLSAILGEMYKIRGKVDVNGSVAFVPQISWIQNKTLKQNILFTTFSKNHDLNDDDSETGSSKGLMTSSSSSGEDADRYQEIIKATALDTDIDILPAGDETEIGEKGINLSGGQKQRVSIARAVYADRDVYLLDDPLSAVDSHVAQHIFDNVIGSNGLLKEKTRILVTHKINVLPFVDTILVLKDGKVSETGTYQELKDRNGDFSVLLKEYSTMNEGGDAEDGDKEQEKDEKVNRKLKEKESKNDGKLIDKEKEEIGKVSINIYVNYFKSASAYLCLIVISMITISSAFNIASNLWLSKWADAKNRSLDIPPFNSSFGEFLSTHKLEVYSILSLLEALTLFLSDVSIFIIALRTSNKLHDNMLSQVLRARMSFFDTTPIGRILNRFTKDIDNLDVYMAFYIRYCTYSSFKVIGTIIIISLNNPYFLVAVFPLSVVYFLIRRLFISSSRQLKRIEASTKSPIFSHFSETISGSNVINAFKVSGNFISEFEHRQDTNSIPWLLSICVSRWNAFRLELIGHITVLTCVLLAMISGEDDAAKVGLSISYALLSTYHLNLLVRFSSDLESNMIAAERVIEYTAIESEADGDDGNSDLRFSDGTDDEWPTDGVIKFENYSTKYRPDLEVILKDVTFKTAPREKVGIVGRTGAGKSSLTLALFRLIEPVDGRILIDGADITKIKLDKLRSRLTIIPQDPVLFTGSLRSNLDPFNEHSDEELWKSLNLVNLKEFVTSNLDSNLNYEVNENGDNFSVGQRQLICLARALLRKSKILILDEATAAIDVETDSSIQKTIQEQFVDCTILTIAHRLNTILDYDRILVLDNGQVVEFDTPAKLLSDTNSMFYSMSKAAGIVR